MKVSGVLLRQVPCLPAAGATTHSSPLPSICAGGHRFSGQLRMAVNHPTNSRGAISLGFMDDGHLRYYHASPRCGGNKEKVAIKKKLKLLKGLSKDLSMLSAMRFGTDPDTGLAAEVQRKMISEATETLLKQLEHVRAEEKELKRKRKQEKAKMKANGPKTMMDYESSSSGSSDNECGQVVSMSHMRNQLLLQQPCELQPVVQQPIELQPVVQQPSELLPVVQQPSELQPVVQQPIELQPIGQEVLTAGLLGRLTGENGIMDCISQRKQDKECCGTGPGMGSMNGTGASSKRIEVCMGNKCKKSGGAALLEEFQRVMGGVEGGAVVGCKCMGKCRNAPNVRVNGIQTEGMDDDSVRSPANSVCIGVGLEDVGVIVRNFFGEDRKEFSYLAPAS